MKTGGGSLPLDVFSNVGGTYAEGLAVVLFAVPDASISLEESCALRRLRRQQNKTQQPARTALVAPTASEFIEFAGSIGCGVPLITDVDPGGSPCLGGGWGEGVGGGTFVKAML
eukprot:COSAG02_NODE_19731_length_867_cov_1.070312_2_plen_114_part_00